MELSSELSAILQVIFINVVLSGDNAIVVGMAAAGAPVAIRKKVIFYGISGAVVLRVLLSLLAVQFLQVVGLLLAGGILLLWVCWKLYREIRESAAEHAGTEALARSCGEGESRSSNRRRRSARRCGRSSSPTFRCRSTTCWPSPARRATTPGSWRPGSFSRSR